MDYYDRKGQPICPFAWRNLHEDFEYRTVARTHVGPYLVSTVWLGFNYVLTDLGPPVIFETMVFPAGSRNELDTVRYGTEAGALIGHAKMVERTKERLKKENL